MHWQDGGWGPGAWVAMAFVMVVFWGLVVTAIVLAVRSGNRAAGPGAAPGSRTPADDPERILAERFARGEIDADEFRERRDLLRSR